MYYQSNEVNPIDCCTFKTRATGLKKNETVTVQTKGEKKHLMFLQQQQPK